MVEKNHSFSSAKGDSDRFKIMFPDSAIAKGYRQSDSRDQYVIKYGIADHLKKQLIYDVKNTSYSFLLDETTNPQAKKQYDGHVIYWPRRSDNIVHSYCGLLFVGHCTAVDLVKHYEEFVKQLDIDSKLLLHKLTQKLSEMDKSFFKLGSGSLHPVHSAFQNGIKQLFQGQVPSATSNSEGSGELPKKKGTFDLDNFFADIHSFFELSGARREDYTSLESVTGVAAEYAKKHAETCWVSMKYVAFQCLEQWPNLKEYFLKFLLKQKNFKHEIENTARYTCLKTCFADPFHGGLRCLCCFSCARFRDTFIVIPKQGPYNSSSVRCYALSSLWSPKKIHSWLKIVF